MPFLSDDEWLEYFFKFQNPSQCHAVHEVHSVLHNMQERSFVGQHSKMKQLQNPSQCHAVHEVHMTQDSKFDSSRIPQLMASATRALAGTWANFLTSIGKHDTTRVEQLPTSGIIVKL